MRHSIIFLLSGILFASCKKTEMADATHAYAQTEVQYKTIAGIQPDLLSLDIYHYNDPANLKPVVFYVHGGGWAVGDKSNKLVNKQNLFYSLDYVFVSINYRLSPDPSALDDTSRIMFPDHNEDVADALKWVIDSIETYGGDPTKIVIMGHSAGAHLVALTATSPDFLPSLGIPLESIKGAVCIDTEGYEVTPDEVAENEIYQNAFGTDATALAAASPMNHVQSSVSYPKFFIAKRGSQTRIELADKFIAKLQNAGVSVSEVKCNQYDHEEINAAIGAKNERSITKPLTEFLEACFQD
jgi:arylformamidase